MAEIKIVSSMEKCFLDDNINEKREKTDFVMFKNENLSFQVIYTSACNHNVLLEIKLDGSLAKYA